MELIFDYNYNQRNDADILVRVYENQRPGHDEQEQCAAEILFKRHLNIPHERFTAWLPRGCANAVVQELKKHSHLDVKVGIANEFGHDVGCLTSVRENFINALHRELEEQKL